MLGLLETTLKFVTISEFIFIIIAILSAGFIRGFTGFGASLIIVMTLSVVFGPLIAVPIACLSGLPSMFQLLPTAIRHAEKSFVLPFGLSTFVAAPFGTLALVSINPSIMKIGISIFVLLSVPMLYRQWHFKERLGLFFVISGGIGAGLIQGCAGVGGPPAVALALSRPTSPQRQRANVIGAVTALSICAIIPLWYHNLFTPKVLILSAFIVPGYVAAAWIGVRCFSTHGHRYFRNAAIFLLAGISLCTLILAIRNYIAV